MMLLSRGSAMSESPTGAAVAVIVDDADKPASDRKCPECRICGVTCIQPLFPFFGQRIKACRNCWGSVVRLHLLMSRANCDP